jgi:DNA-damage-inducible protein D
MTHELGDSSSKIAVFRGKHIRRAIYHDEWYFSVVDIVEVLTESTNPRRYWSDLKSNLVENEGFIQLYEKIVQLKLKSLDDKNYLTDTANTETLFRLIHSIPSPKNQKAAQEGGQVAGNARRELEQKSGRKVVSRSNFLDVNSIEASLIDEK